MLRPSRGLFITGTDTEVGKTYVTALLARSLTAEGVRVGVYKPAASGCSLIDGRLLAEDALALWQAAGKPGPLERVCPQCFQAPLAPHLAAQAEGRELDAALLRSGLEYWHDQCDIVLVEGAGGLLSPISHDDLVADLAHDLGYPLLIVSPNSLGVINQTLQTVFTARHYRGGLPCAGVVLNDCRRSPGDVSIRSNAAEIQRLCPVPLLAQVAYGGRSFDRRVDWMALAAAGSR